MAWRGVAAATVLLAGVATAEGAGEADKPSFCEAARATVDAAALRGLATEAAAATAESTKKVEEAKRTHTAAAEKLVFSVGTHLLGLLDRVEQAQKVVVAANAALADVNKRLGEAEGDDAKRALAAERGQRLQEFEAAKAAYAEATAARDSLQQTIASAKAEGDPMAEAAALASALGTWDALSITGPIVDLKAAQGAVQQAEAEEKAAGGEEECVGKRLAAVEEAEKAAAAVQPTLVASLGDEMKAKQQEIKARKQAVTDAWAASGQIDGGSKVPPLIDAYIAAINEYLVLGAQFEKQVAKLQASGGTVEGWMTKLISHYKASEAELAKWQKR
jgi:hypothetical protein